VTAAADLLLELVEAGAVLWLDGEQIRFRAPAGTLDQRRRGLVAEHRPELVELLRSGVVLPPDVTAWPPDAREDFEERSAIQEFDGGLDRATAEREAEHRVRLRFARAALRAGPDPP